MRVLLVAAALAVFSAPISSQSPKDWVGTWLTSRGVVELEADGDEVTGRLRDEEGSSIRGEPAGAELSVEWRAGRGSGAATWRLDRSKAFFEGPWSTGGRDSGTWRGWREDPDATKGRAAKWDGAWRTSWGIVALEQKGNDVDGELGAQGWYRVDGEATGRRLELRHESFFGTGSIWLEQREPDAAFGAFVASNGKVMPFVAQRLVDVEPAPKAKAGAIVTGLAKNRMLYHLRMPKGWRAGESVPLVVILHGSNMSALPYVQNLGHTIGDRYAVLGVEGERWVDTSAPDDPRHNYTYVNWMGRSTYRGYPHTDRESPSLVAEVIREVKEQVEASKVFVGGHSQGGFLSWFFAMHEPELVDGVFPIAAGLVIQCDPAAFEDEELRAAQREVAIAVVHGRNDEAVPFSQGFAAFQVFADHGFPMLRMFDNDAPHAFSALRWVEAVDWLHAMSSDDPDALLDLAERRIDEEGFKDASAAIARARRMDPSAAARRRADELAARIDGYAQADAERYADAILTNADGSWVEGFLEFRGKFEFCDAAQPVLAAYRALREEHEPKAKELHSAARQAFQRGDRSGGYAKYEQIVTECYASSFYRAAKRALDSR